LVLKITLPQTRQRVLAKVRSFLNCRHSVQTLGDKWVVEIGNAHLVRTLLGRYGSLPSKTRPDPSPPQISQEHFAAFCLGHNAAGGSRSNEAIHWTTTPKVADAISGWTVQQAKVNLPQVWRLGHRCSIHWSRPEDVASIQRWLDTAARAVENAALSL
jgi:hypothetical protein